MAAQTFLQMSDPQFGMNADNKNFQQETANFEFAIASANRLKPDFVVVTGDLTNESGNSGQIAEYKRIAAKLDPHIKLYNVPGNHDVGNEPTAESLARYRERFGPDYYSFRAERVIGIVLNSNLEKGAEKVPDEAAKMEAWLKAELIKAHAEPGTQIIVFQHISFFLQDPNEPDQYFNIPLETRRRYLKVLHQYGVKQVFAGHYHRNATGRDGDLQMITTGPVGKPLGDGASGFRAVKVNAGEVVERYYDFGHVPNLLDGLR
jgi:3',5'-cyclic AMP phosphodiesterase CpdA